MLSPEKEQETERERMQRGEGGRRTASGVACPGVTERELDMETDTPEREREKACRH